MLLTAKTEQTGYCAGIIVQGTQDPDLDKNSHYPPISIEKPLKWHNVHTL